MLISYNPKQVAISFAGFNLESVADGTFCTIAPTSDIFTYVKGIDGKTAYFKNLDFDAIVEVYLLQNSPSDAGLRTTFIQAQQESTNLSNLISSPLAISDLNGGLLWSTASARIMKNSDVTFGRDQNMRMWSFYCENLSCKVNPNVSNQGLLSGLLKTANGFVNNITDLAGSVRTFFG